MKRINKRELFIFILGVIISGTSVYAATLLANSISYDNTSSGINANNVQDAIDSLYTKANNPTIPSNYKDVSLSTISSASDIVSGKTAFLNTGELVTGNYTTPFNTTTANGYYKHVNYGDTTLINNNYYYTFDFISKPKIMIMYGDISDGTNFIFYTTNSFGKCYWNWPSYNNSDSTNGFGSYNAFEWVGNSLKFNYGEHLNYTVDVYAIY